jgi:predicted enzyme related to lactoylglutathione lyase
MLRENQAFSSFSVDDIGRAKQFYAEVLGLDAAPAGGEGMQSVLELHLSGGATVTLYAKGPGHQPATFTVLNFIVKDVEATVRELKARGVQFEVYKDGPVRTDDEGIFRGGPGPTIAWFRDPAGNILSVLERI